MGMRVRPAAFACLLILLLVLCSELMARAALKLFSAVRGYAPEFGAPVLDAERMGELRTLLAPGGEERGMIVFDPALGWKLRAGYRGGRQHTNAAGLVATREYEKSPAAGLVRIAAFGESFTQCVVPNGGTWGQVLEDSCRGIEVLNFGVSAYGPDQAYLRYAREGRGYHPDIVLIGYMTENIWRLVNVFRPYADPMNSPLVKPRFRLAGGDLELIPNPLKSRDELGELLSLNANPAMRDRLGEHDNYYRKYNYVRLPSVVRRSALARLAFSAFMMADWKLRDLSGLDIADSHGSYNTGSEAYRILEALLVRWTGEAVRDGAVPVVLVFPQRSDIEKWRGGGGTKQYRPLLEFMRTKGMRNIDLMEALQSRAAAEVFTADGHYSESGNRLVADQIGASLQEWGLIPGPCKEMERP